MKIRILIKDNLDKIYNILPLIKNNMFLVKNAKNIKYFNQENWSEIFKKTVKEIKTDKKFDSVCIFDDDGMLPFVFFTKQKGFVACAPQDIERARLSRAHNNANCIIMPCKFVKTNQMNKILNVFFTTKHDGGRHATRVRLMQEPFKKGSKVYNFNSKLEKTVVLCADHAGFITKESIKKYLIDTKHLNVIDVGCHSTNSTHYPFFATALVLNARKGFCGIAICSTGVGIANTLNKFKGIKSIVCSSPAEAKLARTKYNANVLALGANFIKLNDAKKAINEFLKARPTISTLMLPIDKLGYEFSAKAFKKIKFDKNIEVPKELRY